MKKKQNKNNNNKKKKKKKKNNKKKTKKKKHSNKYNKKCTASGLVWPNGYAENIPSEPLSYIIVPTNAFENVS